MKQPITACVIMHEAPYDPTCQDVWTTLSSQISVLACTEITKTKKIEILQAVHVVELSWASVVIIFSF